jgi:hypothetical protein
MERLAERHLSLEHLALEVSKAQVFGDEKTVASKLKQTLESDSVSAAFLLSAAKLDDDYKKGLIPNELGGMENLSQGFGSLIARKPLKEASACFVEVNLPPFTKQAVIALLQNLS